MSTSPAIIHQGPLRPKGQFRANNPLLHRRAHPAAVVVMRDVALPSQDTNPKICSSRHASSRAVGALVGILHEFELNKLPHARPNDTRPATRPPITLGKRPTTSSPADRSLPPRVRVRPFCTALGSPSGWSRTTRQVSLTSTLLSCIQSFSRPTVRSTDPSSSEGEGREKTVRRFTKLG